MSANAIRQRRRRVQRLNREISRSQTPTKPTAAPSSAGWWAQYLARKAGR